MKPFKILDCFCGLGGASEGFYSEGFDCTGIDIINMGYPYHFIHADMLALNGKDFHGYDVMWGSPPCRDFTQLPDHHLTKRGVRQEWKRPKQPEVGMVLVKAYLNFVREAQPQFWILENVKGLMNHAGGKTLAVILKTLRAVAALTWPRRFSCLVVCRSKT